MLKSREMSPGQKQTAAGECNVFRKMGINLVPAATAGGLREGELRRRHAPAKEVSGCRCVCCASVTRFILVPRRT